MAKRPANGIYIWSFWPVGNSYRYGLSISGTGNADIPVEFAVTLNTLCRPSAVPLICPREGSGCNRRTQICPVNHILGTVQLPVLHGIVCSIVFVVIYEQIQLVAIYHRSWVRCERCLYYWVLRHAESWQQHKCQQRLFHIHYLKILLMCSLIVLLSLSRFC